jgi:DNA-binding LacI/PurR family transcriptional regulator
VVAFGALDAARPLRIDVPGKLSIVGFDDIAIAS